MARITSQVSPDGSVVYVSSDDHYLYALDSRTGNTTAPDETATLLLHPRAPASGVSIGMTQGGVIKMTVSSMAARQHAVEVLEEAAVVWDLAQLARRVTGRQDHLRREHRRCGHPTAWTALRNDDPNHLELRCNALPEHQTA